MRGVPSLLLSLPVVRGASLHRGTGGDPFSISGVWGGHPRLVRGRTEERGRDGCGARRRDAEPPSSPCAMGPAWRRVAERRRDEEAAAATSPGLRCGGTHRAVRALGTAGYLF